MAVTELGLRLPVGGLDGKHVGVSGVQAAAGAAAAVLTMTVPPRAAGPAGRDAGPEVSRPAT